MFQDPKDLLALAPEDLGGVVIEVAPSFMQNDMFTIDHILNQLYPNVGPSYSRETKIPISRAVAEAISWLVTQGLLIIDPIQHSLWYV
jgi:hypothetical protein